MSSTGRVFCSQCGHPNDGAARFCEDCGAPSAEPDPTVGRFADEPPDGADPRDRFNSRQARERIEELTPGATELASQLAEQFRTPVVAAAVWAGALAAAIVFGIAVVLGLVLPDMSLVGAVDAGKGIVTAGFAQMVNFLQASFTTGSGGPGASTKLGPALFLVFPIGACALAAAGQAARTVTLKPSIRLASGAGTGLVFGLLMLVPALSAGSFGGGDGGPAYTPNVAAAVLLGVLWGAIGGLLGTWYVLRRELGAGFLAPLIPRSALDVCRTAFVIARPLLVALAVMTAGATIAWTVEAVRSANVRGGDSTLVSVVDNVAYSVEHGLQWTELGGLAEFKNSGTPVPVGNSSDIKTDSVGQFRIFGYSKAMPAYTFIALLLFAIGVPLLLALAAGFGVARVQRAPTPWKGAAWGLLVGPVWAVGLVLVNALIAKPLLFYGAVVGNSVFGTFLLGGALVGAIGGFLASQGPAGTRTPVGSSLA